MWPLKFHECDWKNLPFALIEYLTYEKGYRWADAEDSEVVCWPAPDGYVPLEQKIAWYVTHTNFRVPDSWVAEQPGQTPLPSSVQLSALMNMRPMGSIAKARVAPAEGAMPSGTVIL